MLKFLRGRKAATAKPRFRGPEGRTVYAIGDVHGCLAELELLLERISSEVFSTDQEAELIFLGDYVDRGPDSAGVLKHLVEEPLPGSRHSFLMGNHEEAMLAVLDGDQDRLTGWLRFGGLETLASYGIDRAEVLRLGVDLPVRMRQVIPDDHVNFLRRCEDFVSAGDFLFVHAGIRPGIPLADQDSADLRWIRSGFLDDNQTDHGMMVVHGHSVVEEPESRSNRIAIDTGCFRTGRLTALVIEGGERRFLSTL